MTYLLFLTALFVAAFIWGAAHLFGLRLKFEIVFRGIGYGLVFIPILLWSLTLMICVVVGVLLVATGILNYIGLLPTVSALPIWSLFPMWVWILLCAIALFASIQLYQWKQYRKTKSPT